MSYKMEWCWFRLSMEIIRFAYGFLLAQISEAPSSILIDSFVFIIVTGSRALRNACSMNGTDFGGLLGSLTRINSPGWFTPNVNWRPSEEYPDTSIPHSVKVDKISFAYCIASPSNRLEQTKTFPGGQFLRLATICARGLSVILLGRFFSSGAPARDFA